MPNVHPYLPDKLYQKWKPTFDELGVDPSKWVQEQFTNLIEGQADVKTIKERMIERQKTIEKLQLEQQSDKDLVEDLELIEKKRKLEQNEEYEKMVKLDPLQIKNMAKGIAEFYQIEPNKARKLAIEYLSIHEKERPVLKSFIAEKKK